MAALRAGRAGAVAVALAVVGGILALVNEAVRYSRTGDVDWGHVALAVGVPALMYALVRRGTVRPPR